MKIKRFLTFLIQFKTNNILKTGYRYLIRELFDRTYLTTSIIYYYNLKRRLLIEIITHIHK